MIQTGWSPPTFQWIVIAEKYYVILQFKWIAGPKKENVFTYSPSCQNLYDCRMWDIKKDVVSFC